MLTFSMLGTLWSKKCKLIDWSWIQYFECQYFCSISEECLDDGLSLKPKSLYCWLTRILYNRRSKMDPLWNNFIVAGIQVSLFIVRIFSSHSKFLYFGLESWNGIYCCLQIMTCNIARHGSIIITNVQYCYGPS